MPALMRAIDNIDFENNVSTETVKQNIYHASMRDDLEWLSVLEQTDQECLIVAGGPSIKSDIEKIRERQKAGAYILALNGVARFLNSHGITPDALIVLDARPNKNNGFLQCKVGRLFLASQCNPSLFDEWNGDLTLFHIDTPNIGEYVPGERQIQAIGGGATVGLIAMSLAYTRGFRNLHLYGYDSSYQDTAHHAYSQTSNDMDERIDAIVKGRTFSTTPWMIYQVEQFQLLLPQLMNLGCVVTVHGTGMLPFVAWHMTLPQEAITETEKYSAMWAIPGYRDFSPGEYVADKFVEIAHISKHDHVIDFGCGTGRGGKRVQELTHCAVLQIDLVDTARDEGIDLPFICADLTLPLPDIYGDIGMCCDVMEHLPTKNVEFVIDNIMSKVRKCFFQISLVPDNFGQAIGRELHLTVKPAEWWKDKFFKYRLIWNNVDETTGCFFITKKEH